MAKSNNANKKKSSGRGTQQAPVKDVNGIILYQVNFCVEYGKRKEFINHLADNYYAKGDSFNDCSQDQIIKWLDQLIPKSNDYDDNDNESCKVKLPLIAKNEYFPGSERHETKKHGVIYYLPIPRMQVGGGLVSKAEPEPDSVDTVFAGADQLITQLRLGIDALVSQAAERPVIKEEVNEDQAEGGTANDTTEVIANVPQENAGKGGAMKLMTLFDKLDGARDGEKNAYDKLRTRIIQSLQTKFAPNPEEDRLRAQVDKLGSRLSSAEKDRDEYKRKLDTAEADKRKAVEDCEKRLKKQYEELKGEYDKTQKDAKDYHEKWLTEEKKRKGHEATIAERENTIKRLEEESSLYNERVVFFRSTQEFAKLSLAFFDAYDTLMDEMGKQKMKEPSNPDEVDNYNYYMARIERKFLKTASGVKNLESWRHELQLLAQTALVPTGGIIDSKLGGKKVKESEWDSTLRMLLYHDVMSILAGAAVVMSDEMALMLPHQVQGVKGADQFSKISDRLQKAISGMGYDLNYVRPFTKLSQYKDVENVRFTEADVPSGTIFEIMKMALNYGATKGKTEVSAKE